MLKITLPEQANFNAELVKHPNWPLHDLARSLHGFRIVVGLKGDPSASTIHLSGVPEHTAAQIDAFDSAFQHALIV
jgi:hypothetical protein